MPAETVEEIAELLTEYSTTVPPRPRPRFKLRDPDDAIVLESAIVAGADVLVTGDRDLLDAEGVTGIRIVDPRGFGRLVAVRD